MARLRNRIVKADYWGDGDLLRMPRMKRDTYRGLWAIAEDSGCLEDDPFTWKLLLWPGPLDADITIEMITRWRDELVQDGKLIPYQIGRMRLFFIEPFHRHEHPRNPQVNNLPLPPWVEWVQNGSDVRKGLYKVDWDSLSAYVEAHEGLYNPPRDTEQALYEDSKSLVQENDGIVQGLSPARPALPCPALPCTKTLVQQRELDESEFDAFWERYPKKQAKGQAVKAWNAALKKTTAVIIMAGLARQLGELCKRDPQFIPLPATWLNGERWGDEDVKPVKPTPWQPPAPELTREQKEVAAKNFAALAAGRGLDLESIGKVMA